MNTYFTYVESPIGPILLTSKGTALSGLYTSAGRHASVDTSGWLRDDTVAPFPEARRQLDEYFAGTRTGDFDLPLAPDSGTPFQRTVWNELVKIPYGETITYGELARRIGNEKASRAVGLANGQNPISIIVPCHRVIGSNGKLTGYGGGLENKSALLQFEKTARRHAADGQGNSLDFGTASRSAAVAENSLFSDGS